MTTLLSLCVFTTGCAWTSYWNIVHIRITRSIIGGLAVKWRQNECKVCRFLYTYGWILLDVFPLIHIVMIVTLVMTTLMKYVQCAFLFLLQCVPMIILFQTKFLVWMQSVWCRSFRSMVWPSRELNNTNKLDVQNRPTQLSPDIASRKHCIGHQV